MSTNPISAEAAEQAVKRVWPDAVCWFLPIGESYYVIPSLNSLLGEKIAKGRNKEEAWIDAASRLPDVERGESEPQNEAAYAMAGVDPAASVDYRALYERERALADELANIAKGLQGLLQLVSSRADVKRVCRDLAGIIVSNHRWQDAEAALAAYQSARNPK